MSSSVDPHIPSIAALDLSPRGDVFPSPGDWRDVVIYQVLLDRFDDGQDRRPHDGAHRGKVPHPPEAYLRFHGGTIRGIIRRLDYLKGLGATAIWITPPFKQFANDDGSYHGYAIHDFLRIDPRFGTTADLRELVQEAHRRDMYVLLDVVFDHAGDVFSYRPVDGGPRWRKGKRYEFDAWRRGDAEGGAVTGSPWPDDAVWPIELQHPDAFFRMGSMRDTGAAADLEATRGDFHSSKALDMTNPRVVSIMIDIFKYWIAATDLDGFRIDTFRHIELEAGRHFCHAIREFALSIGKRNFLLLGEIVADDPVVARYAGSNSPAPDEDDRTRRALLDCVFDFPLHAVLGKTLRGEQSPKSIREHWAFLHRYFRDPTEAGKHYVRFVENHDFGAGDHKRLMHGDADPNLGILGMAFILLSQGVPCMYQGQEQGFDGGGKDDRYVRECMFGGRLGRSAQKTCTFSIPITRSIGRPQSWQTSAGTSRSFATAVSTSCRSAAAATSSSSPRPATARWRSRERSTHRNWSLR